MANHFKNNNRKPSRANGARYREKPKSAKGFGIGLIKKTGDRPAEKKYTGRRYQPFEWKDDSKEKSVILRFPEENTEPAGRHLREDDEELDLSSVSAPGNSEIIDLSSEYLNDVDDEYGGAESSHLSEDDEVFSDKYQNEYSGDSEDKSEKHAVVPLRHEKSDGKQKILRFQKAKDEDSESKPNKLFRRSKKQPFDPENLPTPEQLEKELKRERNRKDNNRLVRNTIFALITVAAAAVLVATLFLPILQIYGTSMTPTLSEGEIVVSVKGASFERGDIISFYYNNKILVKRVIAFEGEYINIDDEGNVYINNKIIDEPYLTEKAFGECDLKLPYQVPAGKIFVLGDHRSTSVDSRSSVMGCVSEEQIVGKIAFRVWPFDRLGEIN